MLTTELAEAFLKRFIQYIPYQIIITNEKGIVIAGSNKSRVGSFQEIAYKILKTDNLMILTEHDSENFLGSHYGVHSAVLYHGEKIGVVGLAGNPYEVRDMISLVRISLEQMIEYELGRNNDNYRGNLRTQFIHMLLYEETAHTRSELSFLSSQLGYRSDMKRIPLLITCSMDPEDDFTNTLVQLCSASDQDIVIKLTLGQVLVFKSFPDMSDEELFTSYRRTICEFLAPIRQEIAKHKLVSEIPCLCIIGTFQNRLTYYRSSYNHCLWIQNQLDDGAILMASPCQLLPEVPAGDDLPHEDVHSETDDVSSVSSAGISGEVSSEVGFGAADPDSNAPYADILIYYFYDNIGRYVKNITPLPEFHRIYNAVAENIDEEQTRRIIETLDTLQRHNYNMNTASQELNIHKNTLIFRFNKIKKSFHINPVQNAADREFIEYLVYYLNTPK